jgi:chemotaxis protein methyltransferase CheR
MKDAACINFLQWALPKLNMRWPGFRKVRKQACKRIGRRITELNLADTASYRAYLQQNPDEWQQLDVLCRITISRFYRDKGIFNFLGSHVLPKLTEKNLQKKEKTIYCWCIGCASGEEPYSMSLLWDLAGIPKSLTLDLQLLATEVDPFMLARARQGCYPASSIRELPEDWLPKAFDQQGDQYCLKQRYRNRVQFVEQDIRQSPAKDPFHLILCRNLVFTYYDKKLQKEILKRILKALLPGGALVLGAHESLPGDVPELTPWSPTAKIYLKIKA